MKVKAYSINDEDYDFSDPASALDALAIEGLLEEGAVYYEIDTAPVDLSEFLRAEEILERAEEMLSDEVGESAHDAYAASAEAVAELDAALKTWAAKHLSDARVWRCVGKPRELRVTAADVAKYGRGCGEDTQA